MLHEEWMNEDIVLCCLSCLTCVLRYRTVSADVVPTRRMGREGETDDDDDNDEDDDEEEEEEKEEEEEEEEH